jgi:predicted DCC family thiol-disulfide oxidoreductase YuxK
VVPKALRDAVYNVVATRRYRLFGRYEQCMVPPANVRHRFVE